MSNPNNNNNIYSKLTFRVLLVLSCLFMNSVNGFSQINGNSSLSFSRSRALGLGGAVVAVRGNIDVSAFNPATFMLSRVRPISKISLTFNPILPISIYSNPKRFSIEGDSNKKLAESAKYIVKAMTYSNKYLDIGLILNEEKIIHKNSEEFFNGEGFLDNNFHTLVASFEFSSQVRLGVSIISYKQPDSLGVVNRDLGLSYGLFIKPSEKYQIGLTFFDMTSGYENARRKFDRIADESLNIGIAYFPIKDFMISIDVRNLTDSNKDNNFALQEFHYGFEFSKYSHFIIRSGFYREKFLKNDNYEFGLTDTSAFSDTKYSNIFSIGISLIDTNRWRSISNKYVSPTSLISYTFLYKDTPVGKVKWSFLTINFQLN